MTKRKKPEDLLPVGRPTEHTPEFLEKLGKELIEFCKKEDTWHISKFCLEYGKTETWLYAIRQQNPEFSQYIEAGNRLIGNRMVHYGMTKSPNQWLLKTFVPRLLGKKEEINQDIADEAAAETEGKLRALDKNISSKGAIVEFIQQQKIIPDVNNQC